jgi:hypothetical protein
MGKRFKLVGISLAALLVIASVGFYAWTRVARYPAFPEAIELADQMRTERGWYVFEPAAYAPLMQRLSDGGVLAVIVPMPLDLAVLGINRADDVIEAYPDVDSWVIGGHSLGGAMTAEYLKKRPDAVDGLVFIRFDGSLSDSGEGRLHLWHRGRCDGRCLRRILAAPTSRNHTGSDRGWQPRAVRPLRSPERRWDCECEPRRATATDDERDSQTGRGVPVERLTEGDDSPLAAAYPIVETLLRCICGAPTESGCPSLTLLWLDEIAASTSSFSLR